MLKSFVSAVVSALRAGFRVVRAVISIPGRLVAGMLGGTAEPPPAGDSPLVRDLKAELAESEEIKKNCEKIASIIAAWCAESMIAGRPLPAPRPPQVSRAVADWLPGLTREECAELVCASKQTVFEHVRGVRDIPGVRPVQRLAALTEWTPEPIFNGSSGFAAIAAMLETAESSAI